MLHQNRLHFFPSLLFILVFMFNMGSAMLPAAPTEVPSFEATATPIRIDLPTQTPTPAIQPGADPEAWLDGSIDTDQVSPRQPLIVHFNTPMAPESSPDPILSWPSVEGIASWDDTQTVLTFAPSSALDSKKTYTFFLDSALHSTDGKVLKSRTEWIVHVQAGPRVESVSPVPGSLERRYRFIEINFDRVMNPSVDDGMLTIRPEIAFDLKWRNNQTLQIALHQALQPGQRYDLTLNGGNDENALLAEDGSYLAEDYRWFYWQQPLDADVEVLGKQTVAVTFNYLFDKEKSGLPFVVSPHLNGEWQWVSDREIHFLAKDVIPASKEFSLSLTSPLIDSNGVEMSSLPFISFSGIAPIRLANRNMTNSEHADTLNADMNVESLQIEFGVLVDHVSAEKAFSLTPSLPGRFSWQKTEDNSKETLVYTLDELLKPGSVYTVKIDPMVRDAQGNVIMVDPYQQSLKTDIWGAYLSPSFGQLGDNIQIVDAQGRRSIQFSDSNDETNFAAYRFDLIDFAKLYADNYHSRGYGTNVRDIPIPSGLEPSAIWRNIVTREMGDGEIVETILPFDLPPGLYVVNALQKNILYDQMFVVLTSNTLVVKNSGAELFVWLTDINGVSIPEAEVRVYNWRGEKVREGTTDENGQYRVSIPDQGEPMLVSARVEKSGLSGDVTLAGFEGWSSHSENYFWRERTELPVGKDYLAYIYTERPIYKPGQTVNFKAILRKDDDVRYSLPDEGTPVKLRVLDARGNAIEHMQLFTNLYGTVNGAFTISEGAMLGHYQIETDVDGVVASQTFQVEDYRKPDYQIKITSLQPQKENKFVLGEEMKVQINAEYYFGEPLANARLLVEFYYNWPIETKITGALVTDENGKTTLSFPAPYDQNYASAYSWWDDAPRPQRVRMDVTANDGSNQAVTGVYYFTVFPASEQLKLETGGYYAEPGEAFPVTAQVTDLFGQPVAGHSLTLATASWNRTNFDFNRVDQTLELETDTLGTARQDLKLSAGYHELTLQGKDPLGHQMEVKRWIYVFRSKEDWFRRTQDQFLMVSAEKDSYKPYETARLAIESTFSGPALLTFERGSVINTKMVELTAPLTLVETEIIPEHAPNVYVTVNAWQAGSQDVGRYGYPYLYGTFADSYLRMAKTELRVDSSIKALNIDIVTDKEIYLPGETLRATIQVKDSTGNPVPAELSIAAVDEAIYGLANEFSKDIFDAFYGPRAHSVLSFDSMAPYRIMLESGMGGGGGEAMVPPARTDFLDTSAWLPAVETDANGQATITIELPDNTTSWRLSVKAVTLNHQVGQTLTNVETKKDVFLRPVLPRVLTNGDQATLTAFLHNYSTKEQVVTVNLSAPGLEIRSQNDQRITIEPGEVKALGWQVRVKSAKSTQVTITAESSAGILDSILLPLALQPAAIQDIQNQSGQFSGTLTLGLPLPDVEKETSEVRLTLNRSMSGTLLNGLEYLTGYPYGCVEQTMSRALPNAVVARAAESLGVGGPEMQAHLEPLVEASIQRLYGLQHSDGGWGWWTDDVSDSYQTAWVLFGLGVIQEAGYPIEPKVIDQAAEWLNRQILNDSGLDVRTQAYALYSMAQAGRGNLEKTQALVSNSIYELDPFSQAALALALNRLGEREEAEAILDLLSQGAIRNQEFVSWPQPSYDGEYHSKTMSSTVRTTALVLQAYAEIDPEDELVPGVVSYLADQRQGIYGWGTTNETSFTILALTEHLIQAETKSGNSPYEVLVNGKSLAFGTLEIGTPSVGIEIPLAELKDGANALVVKTEGENPVYFDLSTRYDLLQSDLQAAGNIQVTRQYLDPKTKKPIERFEAGQLVRVEVRVNVPENVFFLAVEDHLPGGLEALNEGLSAANQVSVDNWGYEGYQPFYWQDYGYNYKEIRGDRVVFFITTLEKGDRTFAYYARITTPGQFTALPAQAYAMYDSSLWGRSKITDLQISNSN